MFFIGGFLRVALLQQLTWSINSVGHCFGYNAPDSKDQSRDIPIYAVILFGEGLHNYHHRFPTAAVNQPQKLDANGFLIRVLERMGLAWDLRG